MTGAETESRWWTRHVWLGFLAFFITPLFLRPTPVWQWCVSGIALLIFFWLYSRGQRVRGLALVPTIGGVFGIGAALLPINAGASCFFIYAVVFLARVARTAVAGVWLVALTAMAAAVFWWHGLLISMFGILVGMLIVGGMRIHLADGERKNLQLRRSHEEIEQLAKLAERERIGRDLHDLLGHTLSVIVLKSELAAKLADGDLQRSVDEIRDVERISREALSDVRAAIAGYRAQGLSGELDNARRALEAAGVAVSSTVDPIELTAAQESALALALRECVTNVVRHAQATRCTIRLRQEGDRIRLDVEDDGIGGALTAGSGIAGMRARIGAVGGYVEHDGRAGCRLAISIPADVGSPSRAGVAAVTAVTDAPPS